MLVPEEGGFFERFWLVAKPSSLIVGVIWGFIISPPGEAYIKGLTGKSPAELGFAIGRDHGELLGQSLSDEEPSQIEKAMRIQIAECIMASMTEHFLAKNPNELEIAGIFPKRLRKAHEAKNSIFQSCLNNHKVKGLGFDQSHDFPIKREDFESQIVAIPPKEEDEEKTKWVTSIENIKVNSPNWKRDGKRHWQGDTEKFKEITFTIEDDAFWKHVEIKDIRPDINDNIKVQWAHPDTGDKKPSNIRVLRVLLFNGKELSTPLADKELGEIIGNFSHVQPDDQPDLFSTQTV